MLLQTNSYIVPADRRLEHQRLIRRFRQVMMKLGCDSFEVYEQAGPNWGAGENTGRFVQIMRFRDRQHQRQIQTAERNDATAQALIAEFCELINLPYQQQQGLFAVGFYLSIAAGPPALPASGESQPDAELETADQKGPELEAGIPSGETASVAAAESQVAGEAISEVAEEAARDALPAGEGQDEMRAEPESGSQLIPQIEPADQEPPAQPTTVEEHTSGHEPAAEIPAEEPRELEFEQPADVDSPSADEAPAGEFDIEAVADREANGFERSAEERDRHG